MHLINRVVHKSRFFMKRGFELHLQIDMALNSCQHQHTLKWLILMLFKKRGPVSFLAYPNFFFE